MGERHLVEKSTKSPRTFPVFRLKVAPVPADNERMSTPLVVVINALNLLTGGTATIVGKHSAPEKDVKKTADEKVTRLYGGVVVVSKR